MAKEQRRLERTESGLIDEVAATFHDI